MARRCPALGCGSTVDLARLFTSCRAEQLCGRFAHICGKVSACQGQGKSCLNKARFAATIKSATLKSHRMKGLPPNQLCHGISQLNLSACALFLAIQYLHHIGLKNISARHNQVGRRVFNTGFFNQAFDFR